MNVIKAYVLRYFIHRTGVEPNEYTRNFLEKQLVTALSKKFVIRAEEIALFSLR